MKLDLSNVDGLDESIQNQYSGCCGVDGDNESYSNKDGGGTTPAPASGGSSNVDYGQLATQTIGLATQVAGAVKANKESQAGASITKKELKSVCGRKPIFKKKKAKWQECADKYIASKNAQNKAPESSSPSAQEVQDKIDALKLAQKEKDKANKFLGMPKGLGIAVAVLGGLALVVGGIIVVRKMNK